MALKMLKIDLFLLQLDLWSLQLLPKLMHQVARIKMSWTLVLRPCHMFYVRADQPF